jgi:uncharacterized protein (DUF1810 family)
MPRIGAAPSREYAISSLEEARAYLDHSLLGPRLLESASALLAYGGRSAPEILGAIDAVKLRSSMTLFASAAPGQPLFSEVLDRFFEGEADEATNRLLA